MTFSPSMLIFSEFSLWSTLTSLSRESWKSAIRSTISHPGGKESWFLFLCKILWSQSHVWPQRWASDRVAQMWLHHIILIFMLLYWFLSQYIQERSQGYFDHNITIVSKSDFKVAHSSANLKLTYLSHHAKILTWFGSKSATLFAAAPIKKVLSQNKKVHRWEKEGGERPKSVQRIKCPGGVTQSGGSLHPPAPKC